MILVFSGTGNSMFVARELSRILGDRILSLPHPDAFPVPDNCRVIWVFPVYSWGVPPVMCKWIESIDIPNASKVRHSAVMTCGDDTGTTDRQWRRLLHRRGWTGADAWSVQMPNTYVLMKGFDIDSNTVAKEKIEAAVPRIADIAHLIASRSCAPDDAKPISDLVRGSFAGIKSGVIYPWFKRFAMSPKPFFSTDACISCALCARSCPLGNIKMAQGKPQWDDNCALCLRCYHVCPRHAVAYSNVTFGKGQKKQLLDLVEK